MSENNLVSVIKRLASKVFYFFTGLISILLKPFINLLRPDTKKISKNSDIDTRHDIQPTPGIPAQTETTSHLNPTPSTPKKTEPTSEVWQGEPGPELPKSYNKTVLRAIPKNPHMAYVYWDVDAKTQQQLSNTQGESGQAVLRVYGGTQQPQTEIDVQLEPDHCYVSLQPNQTYAFELGTIDQENHYQTLVRSKLLTMPSDPHHPNRQNPHETNVPSSQANFSSPTSWMDATSKFGIV